MEREKRGDFHDCARKSYELEAQHHGEYVMIEVDSGDYFVGKTSEEALHQAQFAHPDKVFYLIRIGYKVAHKLKRS
jgi:hypothetical protein